MKALELQDATASLADHVRKVDKEPVIVSRKGRPVAALVSNRKCRLRDRLSKYEPSWP